MGIMSITPRIDYSQGNQWDVNLKTMADLHEPAMDGIGFQDLITDTMHWADTQVSTTGVETFNSAGKQPAWINYTTSVNRALGNFADESLMWMTLNRRYSIDKSTTKLKIQDVTQYIDPKKFNHIFAVQNRDAMNFWVQVDMDIKVRRKMSARQLPNF